MTEQEEKAIAAFEAPFTCNAGTNGTRFFLRDANYKLLIVKSFPQGSPNELTTICAILNNRHEQTERIKELEEAFDLLASVAIPTTKVCGEQLTQSIEDGKRIAQLEADKAELVEGIKESYRIAKATRIFLGDRKANSAETYFQDIITKHEAKK